MAIQSTNPYTGVVMETFTPLSDAALDDACATAYARARIYRKESVATRAALLGQAAAVLREQVDSLATMMVEEMGKPIQQARGEVHKCAMALDFYAEHGERFLAPEASGDAGYKHYLPLGVVLAVMPWNFPLWQVVRFAAPALMAGNVALLKHASNVPQSALALERVFREAGFAEGCFTTLLLESARVEQLLCDERVAAVTLTGSEGAGSQVGAIAGREIKKSVLELGGSDPFLVMASADVSAAVEVATRARLQNNGQSCIAAKRFIVHDAVYDEFALRFAAAFEAQRVGDPLEETTDIGPLAMTSGADELVDQGQRAIDAGAAWLVEAQRDPDRPNLVSPGILTVPTLHRDADIFAEEFFGPIAQLYRVNDLAEGIHVANATTFGLGSAIFTNDPTEIDTAVAEIEAGATFVNAMVASAPALPFGGVKRSGYGRELAVEGMREFMNLKTVQMG